jgi:hypothetical protein
MNDGDSNPTKYQKMTGITEDVLKHFSFREALVLIQWSPLLLLGISYIQEGERNRDIKVTLPDSSLVTNKELQRGLKKSNTCIG